MAAMAIMGFLMLPWSDLQSNIKLMEEREETEKRDRPTEKKKGENSGELMSEMKLDEVWRVYGALKAFKRLAAS